LVTVVEVSFRTLSSIARSVPVFVTGSPVMSSSPPSASTRPELVRLTVSTGSSVSVPPVDSIVPVLVMWASMVVEPD
jgi:hypothetical protein